MDLNAFQTETGGLICPLENPITGEALLDDKGEVAVRLMSPESREYKAIAHEYTNKRLKRMNRRNILDAAELDVQNVEMLARVITGFTNFEYDGKVPSTLREKIDMLNALPWVRKQCEAFLQDEKNFIKA